MNSRSFLLREGENIFWVELISIHFSRREISDYLDKARQIQSAFPSGVLGILAAPDFEPGIREQLDLLRIPVRLFRYQEGMPLGVSVRAAHESVLWLEEVTVSRSDRIPPPCFSVNADPAADIPLEENLTSSWNRLSREELREFIQLELEVAGPRGPATTSHK